MTSSLPKIAPDALTRPLPHLSIELANKRIIIIINYKVNREKKAKEIPSNRTLTLMGSDLVVWRMASTADK